MDVSLIISGATTLLHSFLTKAGGKAAETIGEKIAKKAMEKTFWEKVKSIFVDKQEHDTVEEIEKKPVASQQEIAWINKKVTSEISSNPTFASEILTSFKLTPVNLYVAELILKSITADKAQLEELYKQRRLAGIEAEGPLENMISKVRKRLETDEKEFIQLITSV